MEERSEVDFVVQAFLSNVGWTVSVVALGNRQTNSGRNIGAIRRKYRSRPEAFEAWKIGPM